MTCPHPEKAAYPDRADQHGPALDPYPCPSCGLFHLTGKTDLGAKIAAALNQNGPRRRGRQ